MKNIIEELIKTAFLEDIPNNDITTDNLNVTELQGRAQLVAKSDMTLSGSDLFEKSMKFWSDLTEVKWHFKDGDKILSGQKMATIIGDLTRIIQAERVALNFLGHLSGIATLTNKFVSQVEHTDCKILDTRKTLPGYRLLEKRAVCHGGGHNHRMNLSDSVLIKENHIALANGLENVLKIFKEKNITPLHVEVKNLDEAKTAFNFEVNRLLLDNMTNEEMLKIVKIRPSGIELEASGNMNLQRVKSVAEIGINYISVGMITHSAPCADLSLIFDWKEK
ncbi:MAG: carboxylating nicotinate-nucleotide diphosphorylase [Bdellovibrionales bacterium]|nr:carboxylating nicotinate-nucleotide diphosphorylase [Bdellovibrionales bacterium]